MRHLRTALIVLAISSACAACGTSAGDTSRDRAVLSSQLKESARLISTGELDDIAATYVQYFADDAMLLTAPGAVVVGKVNIREFYERVASNVSSIEWTTADPTILIDGSLAVLWYTGVTRAVYVGQDSVSTVSTRYTDVWRKQEDGSWKIMLHAWTR